MHQRGGDGRALRWPLWVRRVVNDTDGVAARKVADARELLRGVRFGGQACAREQARGVHGTSAQKYILAHEDGALCRQVVQAAHLPSTVGQGADVLHLELGAHVRFVSLGEREIVEVERVFRALGATGGATTTKRASAL